MYDSTGGAPIYNQTESTAPWCLNGDTGGVCTPISSYAWPNGVPIVSGATYTITMRARDNDPHRQYTRIVETIRFNPPTASLTRTPTRTHADQYADATRRSTPTMTLTPSKTVPATNTYTPSPTRTSYADDYADDADRDTDTHPDVYADRHSHVVRQRWLLIKITR